MGIYLPNMETPETCKLCYLSEFDPGFHAYICKPTRIWIDYDIAKVDRPRTICPLVPVSTPHGRLIDADVLYEDCALDNEYEVAATTTRINEYMQLKIDATPTLAPAEEEKIR